jgi:hypothetical protein
MDNRWENEEDEAFDREHSLE